MVILQFTSFILIAVLLIGMLATARPRMKSPLPGKPLHTFSVGFRPKLAIYRSTLLALLTGCVLLVLLGWLSLNLALIVAAIALGMIATVRTIADALNSLYESIASALTSI